MFSLSVEYSVRAMVLLANSVDRPLTIGQLAKNGGMRPTYLSKLMARLRRAGLVRSQKGIHGGHMLTRRPSEITLYEVVTSIECVTRTFKPWQGSANHETLGLLDGKLNDILNGIKESLAQTTLEDLRIDNCNPPGSNSIQGRAN